MRPPRFPVINFGQAPVTDAASPRILLAPMEGLADDIMRAVLTGLGGYDWGIAEFIRVTGSVLPRRSFVRTCPELESGGCTESGTPMRVQLLGSDPDWLAANARRLVGLAPPGIDLNFGCPAPTVNRHRGGAALLGEPDLLYRIVSAVRQEVPRHIPFTAKMRLGIDDTALALDCARALAEGGADELIVHARTRADGYRPPARWPWIGRIRDVVGIPVIANGEVWSVADCLRCREESGCPDIMLGRGALADPWLALRLRDRHPAHVSAEDWQQLAPALDLFWRRVRAKIWPPHAPGRLKQWLNLLRRHYPQAEALYLQVRPISDPLAVDALLAAQGLYCPAEAVA